MICLYYASTGKPVHPASYRHIPNVEQACVVMYASPELRDQGCTINAVDSNGRIHAKLEDGRVYTWNTTIPGWQPWGLQKVQVSEWNS